MAENQPGLGRGAGSGDRAGSVTAGFKVDTKSLDNLNKLWERLVQNVRNFNAELKKIDGKAMDRFALGMGRMPGMTGAMGSGTGGYINGGGGQFSLAGAGRTASGLILPNAGIPAARNLPASQQPQGNGGAGAGGGLKAAWAALPPGARAGITAGGAVLGAGAAFRNSQRDTWADSERLAQLTAWGGGGTGNIDQVMGQARHFQAGLTGYSNTADLFSGLQTIREQQGLSMTARSRALQQSAGRVGNLLGSFDQGASGAAGFYSPQAYYGLMPLGVKTIGTGGKQAAPEDIAQQLLKRIYGGRMPTSQEINEGRAQGSNMRATMNSLGLDASTQEFVYSYGETAGGRSPAQMKDLLSKTGSGGAFGTTLFDADRRKAQTKAQASQELADQSLPALRAQVDATTGAFKLLNRVLGGPLGPAIGGGVAGAGAFGGLLQSGSNLIGSAGGSLLANYLMFGRRGGGGVGTGIGTVLGRAGGAARGAVGRAGFSGGVLGPAAVGIGGTLAGGAVAAHGGRLGQVGGRALQGASMGAALGMMGGPFAEFTVPGAAAIGGLAGGLMGLTGLGGAGGTGSVEEIDAITAGLGRVMSMSTGAAYSNQDTAGSTTGGAMDGAPAGVSTGVGTARGSKADAWMEQQSRGGGKNWFERCLEAVRTSLGVPGGVKSAAISFAGTKKRHSGTPPPGVPVWWTGGAYGHVALSAGGGMVWSNDILRRGGIDKVPISLITKKWGKQYQGWSEDINGVDVYNPSGGSTGAVQPGGVIAPGGHIGSGGSLGGNAAIIARFLTGKGLGHNAIAGILGNLKVESGLDPTNNTGDGGTSWGLAQWHLGRKDAMVNYARRHGRPWTDINSQLGYLWQELSGGGYGSMLSRMAKSSPGGAAAEFDRVFEVSSGAARAQRMRYAEQFAVQGYEKGSWKIARDQLAMIHKGEMVVPANSAKRVRDYVKRGANTEHAVAAVAGGGRGVTVHMNVAITVPPGTTQAQAKYIVSQMASQLESDARIAAVMGGD